MSQPPRMYDISVPIRPGMAVYEGDPAVNLERVTAISDGAQANVSRLDMGVHTGTHIDAPAHFIEGAPAIDDMALEAMIGRVQVVDATHVHGNIDAKTLDTLEINPGAERLIFKTPNSSLWDMDRFARDFIGLTEDAAKALAATEIRLVGIDYLSIAPMSDPGPTHRVLLQAGVVILEGLDLRAVAPGEYELICLPLRLVGSDGAPARAILQNLR